MKTLSTLFLCLLLFAAAHAAADDREQNDKNTANSNAAPAENTLIGFYRVDRWGDARFAHFRISPKVPEQLNDFRGAYARVDVGRQFQHPNPDPAILLDIEGVHSLPYPWSGLGIVPLLEPEFPSPSTPFKFNVVLKNYGEKPLVVRWGGCSARITAEARDPVEIQKHWSHLWGSYTVYYSNKHDRLISTGGLLVKEGGCTAFLEKKENLTLAPAESLELSLPFDKGLPVGRYDSEFFAYARPEKEKRFLPCRSRLFFNIGKLKGGPVKGSITVTHKWKDNRPEIPEGSSLKDVNRLLGSAPTKTNLDNEKDGDVRWDCHYSDSFGNTFRMSCEVDFVKGNLTSVGWAGSFEQDQQENNAYNRNILVVDSELQDRYEKTRKGQTIEDVNKVLGGKPFTGFLDDKGTGEALWRFVMLDAKSRLDLWAIFMGAFKDGRLVEGTFLPG